MQAQTGKGTTRGQAVATVNISGKQYVTVAERVRVALDQDDGYELVGSEPFELNGRYFIRATIRVGARTYQGTSEIKFSNASKGTAADKAPMEDAETSAVGRALGFAGIGLLDSIATADEMERAGFKRDASPAASAPHAATTSSEADAEITYTPEDHSAEASSETRAFGNLGLFLTACVQEKGYANAGAVMQALGVKTLSGVNLAAAFANLPQCPKAA